MAKRLRAEGSSDGEAPYTSEKGARAPVVLVDMDGTIAAFDRRVYALMAQRHPEVEMPPYENRTFPMSRGCAPKVKPLVTALFSEEGFFSEMEPIEGAVEALHGMLAAGVEVYLCSAPLSNSPRCAMEKVQWVAAHLGQSWVDRLVLTRDKTLVRGDVLIDDAPVAKGRCLEPAWEHVYFDQPYNRLGRAEADASRRRLVAWKAWRSLTPLITREKI